MALTITCPVCGKRNGYEFRYGGEDKGPRPDENNITPQSWCDFVHMNKCVAGVQKEWWFHRDGCGSWFTIHRDTTTNLEVAEPETKLELNGKKAVEASEKESEKNLTTVKAQGNGGQK